MPLFHPDADLFVEPEERDEHLTVRQDSQRDVSSDRPCVELDGALILCIPAGEHTIGVDVGPAHAHALTRRSSQEPARAARMSSAVLNTPVRAAGWSRRSFVSSLASESKDIVIKLRSRPQGLPIGLRTTSAMRASRSILT
jgi:hypothetical protein